MNEKIQNNGILQHHGILGQKWGVRRYQDENGNLTTAGKKRISKEYKKAAQIVTDSYNKKYQKMYLDSYNKAADKMNNGEIEKFNKVQEKKYGKDFAKREGYEDDYMALFDSTFQKNMNKSLNDFFQTDETVKKARALVKKYKMTEWDDLAKDNEAVISEVRSTIEKQK